MTSFFKTYATPFTTGLFLVSLISGIALFFHVGPSGFHGMHEILSMVLILPFVLHLWKNWRPMTAYLRHAPMAIALTLSLGAALAFLYPAGQSEGRNGPPQFAFAGKMLAATPAEMAAVLDVTPETLATALTGAGFQTGSGEDSLAKIAEASGKTTMQMIAVLNGL